MVYFIVVVVVVIVTTFTVLWPKKVIIYSLVIDKLIPKYVRLAHPSGTPFVVLAFPIIIFHLFAFIVIEAYIVTLKNIVPSFVMILAVPYIRIKEVVLNERVATLLLGSYNRTLCLHGYSTIFMVKGTGKANTLTQTQTCDSRSNKYSKFYFLKQVLFVFILSYHHC